MTSLFELKEQILRFCSRYESYLRYVSKFVISFVLFALINGSIGFEERLSTLPVAVVLAVGCSLFPIGTTALVAMILVMIHLFVLSAEVALVTFFVFGVVLFLYFRFSPQDMVLFTTTPILCAMGIPYVLPIATGLLRKRHSAIALMGGAFLYYFVAGIYENVNALKLIVAGVDVDGAKLSIAVGQIFENQEIHLMLLDYK